MSVPFITYGGLHSSIALREARDLLVENGREVIDGMKIASFHTLSKTLNNVINSNKPNDDDFKIIRKLADRILYLYENKGDIEDVRECFDYAPDAEKELCSKMSQDDFHRDFRNVTFDSALCVGCGACINHCPVNRLELVNGKAAVKRETNNCIICGECFHKCPMQAVNYPYINKVRPRLENSQPVENPQSAVYPIK